MTKLCWIATLPRINKLGESSLQKISQKLEFGRKSRLKVIPWFKKKIIEYESVKVVEQTSPPWKITVSNFSQTYCTNWKESEGITLKKKYTTEQLDEILHTLSKPIDIYIWPNGTIIFVRDFISPNTDDYTTLRVHIVHLYEKISSIYGKPFEAPSLCGEYNDFNDDTIKKILLSECNGLKTKYNDAITSKIQEFQNSLERTSLLHRIASYFGITSDLVEYYEKKDLENVERLRMYYLYQIQHQNDYAKSQRQNALSKVLDDFCEQINADGITIIGLKTGLKLPSQILQNHLTVFISIFVFTDGILPLLWSSFLFQFPILVTIEGTSNVLSILFANVLISTGILFVAFELVLGFSTKRH